MRLPTESVSEVKDGGAVVAPATPTRLAVGTQENVRIEPEDVAKRYYDDDIECLIHDLKTPIATIALAVDVLETPVSEQRRHMAVTMVRRNLAFLDRLVRALLDATHERGEPTESSDLATVLEQVVESLPPQHRDRILVDVRARPRAVIDGVEIQRVIANLITNALAYTPAHTLVEAKLEALGERARISVIDRGPGLSFDDARRIFEKYERGQSTHSGSGLGLYSCRKIVERHGGRIAVETSQTGSRFYFEIPLARSEAVLVCPPAVSTRLGAASILVIEGDDHDAAELSRVLQAAGANVTIANTGSDALARVTIRPPDVLVIDLELHGSRADGFTLLALLRDVLPEVPILVLCDPSSREHAKGVAGRGAYAVEKPLEAGSLIVAIEALLLAG